MTSWFHPQCAQKKRGVEMTVRARAPRARSARATRARWHARWAGSARKQRKRRSLPRSARRCARQRPSAARRAAVRICRVRRAPAGGPRDDRPALLGRARRVKLGKEAARFVRRAAHRRPQLGAPRLRRRVRKICGASHPGAQGVPRRERPTKGRCVQRRGARHTTRAASSASTCARGGGAPTRAHRAAPPPPPCPHAPTTRTGAKAALVSQCVDGELHGALPRCPLCEFGRLKTAEGTKHMLVCPGHFSESARVWRTCGYKAEAAKASRLPWRTAEEGPRAVEAEPAAAGGAQLDAAQFDGLSPQAAADRLVSVAREAGATLSADETTARIAAGTALNASRDEEGKPEPAKALRELLAKYGRRARACARRQPPLRCARARAAQSTAARRARPPRPAPPPVCARARARAGTRPSARQRWRRATRRTARSSRCSRSTRT